MAKLAYSIVYNKQEEIDEIATLNAEITALKSKAGLNTSRAQIYLCGLRKMAAMSKDLVRD